MKFLQWYSPKFKTELEKLIPDLKASLKSKEVDAKQIRRFKALINKTNIGKKFPRSSNQGWSEIGEFLDCSFRIYLNPEETLMQAKKHLKKAKDQEKDSLNLVIEMCEAFKEPVALLKSLEELKEQSKLAYTPERASNPVIKKIHDMLTGVTKNTHKQLTTQWNDIVMGLVTSFEKRKNKKEGLYDFYRDNPWATTMVSRLIRRKDGRMSEDYVRNDKFKETLNQIVKDKVDEIQFAFISKNIAKLSPIVEKRTDFEGIALQKASVSAGNLEGVIGVSFKKLKFVVKSQIVWSTSSQGTSFVRYPTTFHEVEWESGKVAKASEEEMNEKYSK